MSRPLHRVTSVKREESLIRNRFVPYARVVPKGENRGNLFWNPAGKMLGKGTGGGGFRGF